MKGLLQNGGNTAGANRQWKKKNEASPTTMKAVSAGERLV
jgi:hypothetical protein